MRSVLLQAQGVTELAQLNNTPARKDDHPEYSSCAPLKILIPHLSSSREAAPSVEELSEDDDKVKRKHNGKHTFCPPKLRDIVVDMMERHLCADSLIPGYSAPTFEGIKARAVKQIYEFCVHHDLPNLWA
jgi:hypothetical protein